MEETPDVTLWRIDDAMADQLQSPVLPEDLVTEAIPGNLDKETERNEEWKETQTQD